MKRNKCKKERKEKREFIVEQEKRKGKLERGTTGRAVGGRRGDTSSSTTVICRGAVACLTSKSFR
jgi:hypothetical protein